MVMMHLVRIEANQREFGASAVEQAEEFRPFYMASSTVILLIFNMDVQDQFSKQSLLYQDRDQSIIGQAHSKADLISGIDSCDTESGGEKTTEFLKV